MPGRIILFAFAAALMLSPPVYAGEIDQRIEAVGQAIDKADAMFNMAKKGHLPSLEVINQLYARMALARELHESATANAANGEARRAGAELDAAEHLADLVYKASEH